MIEVLHYSPKMRMQYRKVIRGMLDFYKDLAPDYDVSPDELFEEITDFAMLSLRVHVNGSLGLDFETINSKDNVEIIKSKTLAYLNTETFSQWSEVEQAVRAFDTPSQDETAPQLDSDDPNSKGDGGTGSKK